MTNLSGKHAVVTGGNRGIGAVIAEMLIEQGASVTIMGRNPETLKAKADAIGAQGFVCDVSQPESVEKAFAEISQDISILINNAGIAESAPFHRTDLDMWNRIININLTGTYLCTQQVISGMLERKQGCIINMASIAGLSGVAYATAYAASKHAVVGLTKSLALEVDSKGITVNAVCPGYTDTDMVSDSVARVVKNTKLTAEQATKLIVQQNPSGRIIKPEEVGNIVLWLCSDTAKNITGQSITIA